MNTDVDPNTNYLVIEFDGQRGWSVIGKGTGREITERLPIDDPTVARNAHDQRVLELGQSDILAVNIDNLNFIEPSE